MGKYNNPDRVTVGETDEVIQFRRVVPLNTVCYVVVVSGTLRLMVGGNSEDSLTAYESTDAPIPVSIGARTSDQLHASAVSGSAVFYISF